MLKTAANAEQQQTKTNCTNFNAPAATTMEESLGVQGTPAIFYVSFMY